MGWAAVGAGAGAQSTAVAASTLNLVNPEVAKPNSESTGGANPSGVLAYK